MKRVILSEAFLDIKRESAKKMVDACLSRYEMTRELLSGDSGFGLSSAGKLLNSLYACKICRPTTHKPESGGKVCRHFVFNPLITVGVFDISSFDYSFTLVNCRGDALLHLSYRFDMSESLKDNLALFISRISGEMLKQELPCSALSLMLPDKARESLIFDNRRRADERDIPTFCSLVSTYFANTPVYPLWGQEAAEYAFKYKLFPIKDKNFTYICSSDELKIYHFHKDGGSNIFRADRLFYDKNTLMQDKLSSAISATEFGELMSRVVNFSDCLFPAEAYFIESTLLHQTSEVIRELKRPFALLGEELPDFYFKSKGVGMAVLGASRYACREYIMEHLKFRDDAKC